MSKQVRGIESPVPPYMPDDWNGILIVGDYPTKTDVQNGTVFRSQAGLQLNSYLSKVGIVMKKCAQIYAFPTYPKNNDINPHLKMKVGDVKNGSAIEVKKGRRVSVEFYDAAKQLRDYIVSIEPKFIIVLGEAGLVGTLWEFGIDDFRGSMEQFEQGDLSIPVLPTHSPTRVFKQPQLRFLVSHDLARVTTHLDSGWPEPPWEIAINPTYSEAVGRLQWILDKLEAGEQVKLGVDIETRRRFYIGTIGFAWSDRAAIVVPFIRWDWKPYWESEDEERILVLLIKQILEHENVRVAGQNYHYDAQYLARHWGIRSSIWIDTMIAHHVRFSSDIKKGLHVISSLYCEYHQYWKDESHGEDDDKWEPTQESWDNYLLYNGKDCCKTLDAALELEANVIVEPELIRAHEFQNNMWGNLLKCMLRGNQYDWDERRAQRARLEKQMAAMERFMFSLVPESVYPRNLKTPFFKSPTQLKDLFYHVLAIPPYLEKNAQGIKAPTTNDAAMKYIGTFEPILKPLCEAISEYRSMRVFYDNFLTANPDYDDKMRSGYLLAGTSTYRLASRGDVFDFGMNLQNVSKGG